MVVTLSLDVFADDPCGEDIVPGVERISRGVDITELDLTPPFKASRSMLGGLRSPIVAFTCSGGEKWRHPQTDTTYQVPDQLQRPATLPSGSLRAVTKVSGDSEELKKSWSTTVGGGAEGEKFGFSASATFKGALETLHQDNRTVAETTCSVSTHVVDFKLPKHLTLTEDFTDYFTEDDADGVVATYEEARPLYDKFIKQFGTHYFESATFGGTMVVRTYLKEEYVSSNDESSVETDLEGNFLEKFKVNVATEHSRSNVSDAFRSTALSEFGYYGGKVPDGLATDSWDWFGAWTELVNKDPWLTGGRLKSISELFTGEVKNRTVEVRKAIRVHLAKAYLQELRLSVHLGRYRLTAKEMAEVEEAEKRLLDKRPQAVDETVKMLDEIFKQIQVLKDRLRLQQLQSLWEDGLLDVINCKSHVVYKCRHLEWEAYSRKADALLDFYEQVKERTSNFEQSKLDHAGLKLLYRDARNAVQDQRASLNMCRDLAKKEHCIACVKAAVNLAVSHEFQPFCTSKVARNAVKPVL